MRLKLLFFANLDLGVGELTSGSYPHLPQADDAVRVLQEQCECRGVRPDARGSARALQQDLPRRRVLQSQKQPSDTSLEFKLRCPHELHCVATASSCSITA